MAEESDGDRQDPPADDAPPEPAVRPVDDTDGSDDTVEPEPAIQPVDNGDSEDSDDEAAAGSDGADDSTDTGDAPADEPVIESDDEFDSLYAEENSPLEANDTDPPADAESDGGYTHEEAMGGIYEDTAVEPEPVDIDDGGIEGAPDDEEMPLADHIEEMVKRLGVVVVVMAGLSGVVFPFGTDLINFLWFHYLPGTIAQCPGDAATVQTISEGGAACARVYHPLAVVLARLKVATLAGFVVALPVFVYETYLFMRPGLYPHERRYYIASVPTSLVLAAIGMLFAHFLVIPLLFDYFVYYSQNATVIAFGLAETFDLIVLLLGAFALVFQIPLFIMLALMMGLVTREWLETRRLIFWGVFAGLAFLFTADPTGMGPIVVAATMIVLFEGTLLLARWTGKE